MDDNGLISRRTSRMLFLGLSWAGVLGEAAFALPVILQRYALGREVNSQYIYTFAPVTVFFGFISLTMFSWWMANRHMGVPCYKEVLEVSMGHAAFVVSIVVGALLVLVAPGYDLFIYYVFWAPAIGELAVLLGLLYYTTKNLRRRTPSRAAVECSTDRRIAA